MHPETHVFLSFFLSFFLFFFSNKYLHKEKGKKESGNEGPGKGMFWKDGRHGLCEEEPSVLHAGKIPNMSTYTSPSSI